MVDQRTEVETQFVGFLSLRNSLGTLYGTYLQTGVLSVAAGVCEPGGWALIKIVANGSAINLPAAWIKYGGDDISIVNGDENHLSVLYADPDTIYYTNKVV